MDPISNKNISKSATVKPDEKFRLGSYVECFVAAVPDKNEQFYKQYITDMGAVIKDHGAIRVVDTWGVDVSPGKTTSFPMAVKAQPDETVVLGWVEWASRKARDEGMPKAMQDPRIHTGDMPFDGKRLIFAGFEVFSDQ